MVNVHEQSSEFHRIRQPDTSSGGQVHHDGAVPCSVHGLVGSAVLGASYNTPVRAQAMHGMQRTYGNRAVQRHVAANASKGRVAVQRSPSPTETLATMGTIMGKDNPGFEYLRKQMGMEPGGSMHTLETLRKHGLEGPGLDYMARQMGMDGVSGKPNGPYGEAGENEAGGYEARFRANGDKSGWADTDVGFGEGAIGAWDEDGGGTQYGIKGKVGLVRGKINEGGDVPVNWEAGTAGAEFSGGENGVRAQAGVTAIGVEGTLGGFDKERNDDIQARGGLSIGPSLGARLHWGDSDHDGYREYGLGADIGPFSFDVKSEDPLRAYMGWDQRNLPGQNMTNAAIDAIKGAYSGPAETVKDAYFGTANTAIDIASDILGWGGLASGPSEADLKKQQVQESELRKQSEELEKNPLMKENVVNMRKAGLLY